MGNWDEFIIYIIIGLFMFGGWIINTIKAANDSKQKKADAQLAGDEEDITAEELAARVRQAKQGQRQQSRQQSTASTQRPRSMGDIDAAEPGNMTMAERIARAKAKQQYEQRQRSPQSLPGSANAQRSPDAHETRQREMQTQREARSRSASQQQQLEANQRQQSRQGLRSNASTRRQAAAAGTDPTQDFMAQRERARNRLKTAQAQAKAQQSKRTKHALGSEVGSASRQTDSARRVHVGRLRRSDLRHAIVMKEILDKPIANRDPLDALGQ